MADATQEILIKILTAYDKGGMDAVSAELKQINAAADQSAGELDEASRAAANLSQTLQGVASSASGSTEGMFRVASGIRALLGAIDPTIAKGGLLVATFLASYTATRKVVEAFSSGRQTADEFKTGLQRVREEAEALSQTKLDDINQQYRDTADAIDRAAQAHGRLNAARLQLMDARTAAKVADVDLREKQSLAGLAPDDEIGRSRVRLGFQTERAGIQDAAAAERARSELDAARASADAASKKADAASAAVVRLEGEIAALRNSVTSKQTAVDGVLANPPLRTDDVTQIGLGGIPVKVGERQVVDQAAADKMIRDLNAQITRDATAAAELQRQLDSARAQSEALRAEAQAAGIGAQAAEVSAGTAENRPAATAAETVSATKQVDYAAKQQAANLAKDAAAKSAREREISETRAERDALADLIREYMGADQAVDSARGDYGDAQGALAGARRTAGRASRQAFAYRPVAEAEASVQRTGVRFNEANSNLAGVIERMGGSAEKVFAAVKGLEARLKRLETAQNFGGE